MTSVQLDELIVCLWAEPSVYRPMNLKNCIPNSELGPAAIEHPVTLSYLQTACSRRPVPWADLDSYFVVNGGSIDIRRRLVHHNLHGMVIMSE